MSDKCPSCGSDFDFRASRAMPGWEGGWPYNQFKCYSVLDDNGFHQSDRCRIRAMKAAGLNAINTLRNARDRTDSYEDDLEYERAIDLLIKAGCGPTTEGGTDD